MFAAAGSSRVVRGECSRAVRGGADERAVTEQIDRFTLTTRPDGRALLALALRRHPQASADGFARAQRYWACAPGGAQPRWLALAAGRSVPQRSGGDDVREAAEAHRAAVAYLPGVSCSGCGDRVWKPVHRAAVTRYVLTGVTGDCLTCHQPPKPAPVPPVEEPAPAQTVEVRTLPAVTVRVDGTAAAMLWNASGGDMQTMSSLVTELIARNFGIRRPVPDLV